MCWKGLTFYKLCHTFKLYIYKPPKYSPSKSVVIYWNSNRHVMFILYAHSVVCFKGRYWIFLFLFTCVKATNKNLNWEGKNSMGSGESYLSFAKSIYLFLSALSTTHCWSLYIIFVQVVSGQHCALWPEVKEQRVGCHVSCKTEKIFQCTEKWVNLFTLTLASWYELPH